jgi:levansucrase
LLFFQKSLFRWAASKRVSMSTQSKSEHEETALLRPATSLWRASHVAQIATAPTPQQAEFTSDTLTFLTEGMAFWDIWPVQCDDGFVPEIDGTSLWVMLSAPRAPDPDSRHAVARMRLIAKKDGIWIDCGDLLPDGFSPGSREWSGSSRIDLKRGQVTLWFTASGRRGIEPSDFEQRLFQTSGQLDMTGSKPHIGQWTAPTESVVNDGRLYADLRHEQGVPGRIKGFRDPYWFRDPANGQGYLLFTGSKPKATSQSDHDGVIGLALANDENGFLPFTLQAPLVDADGLVNELERPHMIVRDGLYYLFWSSQGSVFSPSSPVCPTGLYGMVGPSIFGPFEPLNGTGLVLSNPISEPRQAYAWQVLPTLEVISFVDYWGLKGRDVGLDPALKFAQFGGTISPFATIEIKGTTTRIVAGGQ